MRHPVDRNSPEEDLATGANGKRWRVGLWLTLCLPPLFMVLDPGLQQASLGLLPAVILASALLLTPRDSSHFLIASLTILLTTPGSWLSPWAAGTASTAALLLHAGICLVSQQLGRWCRTALDTTASTAHAPSDGEEGCASPASATTAVTIESDQTDIHEQETENLSLRNNAGDQGSQEDQALSENPSQELETERALPRRVSLHPSTNAPENQFLLSISHELRTPLTLILNPLEQALRSHPEDPNLTVASRNSKRMLRLVNQLLDFQKLQAGKRELNAKRIDLVQFIDACSSYFVPNCRERWIFLALTLDGNPLGKSRVGRDRAWVNAEIDALEKIAFNYLSNALKFTPDSGRIELGLIRNANSVRLFVEDTGPGIDPGQQGQLFKLFSQLDGAPTHPHEGTGLGLALVKELTLMLGGKVGVDSEPGSGSTFWVDFPRYMDGPSEEDADPNEPSEEERLAARDWLIADAVAHAKRPLRELTQASSPKSTGAEIMIVDDMADMRDLICNVLTDSGYRFSTPENGQAALDMARFKPPDLMIIDWMMPVLSGTQLVEKIREDSILKSVPVILLTARSDAESQREAVQSGADIFMGKPFSPEELLAAIHNLLQLKEREREVARLNHRITEQGLKRCLPPALVDAVLQGDQEFEQRPESTTCSLVVASLAGFSRAMRTIQAARAATLLNNYLQVMSDVAGDHGGTVERFAGDQMIILFGAPTSLSPQELARRSCLCAIDMQLAMGQLREAWTASNLPAPMLRLGVHQGMVLVGTFGSDTRSDYMCVGPALDLTEQIERHCPPDNILISKVLADYLPEEVAEPVGSFPVGDGPEQMWLYRLLPDERQHLDPDRKDAA